MRDFEAAAEEALARYKEKRIEAMALQRRILDISGTAVSKRQSVKITVNVHGEITSIEFPTGAYKRMTPTELAEAVKATAQEAKAKAVAELREMMQPKMPGGVDLIDLIQGKADLPAMLPNEPQMTDAAAEYIRAGLPGSRPGGGSS